MSAIARWVSEQTHGRSWWVRAPLLPILLFVFVGYLGDPLHTSLFDGVTLAIHEAGHAAFSWFGSAILTTAGGTIFQVGIPALAGSYLLVRQRDPFGAAFCLFWMGTALFGAGVYAADARAQSLPLVSPFGPLDPTSHDWTVMLMKYGMLNRDQMIGAALRHAGEASMALGITSGTWVLRVMARSARTEGL